MAKFDLDRLERLAGYLAVLFYGLLFLAFITAVMGSGGGGLLLLVLGAVAHVGRVGLEELVAKRRELGGAPATGADDSERATGLRLKWLPREIRLAAGKRAAGRSGTSRQVPAGSGEAAGRVAAGTGRVAAAAGEAAAAALGHAGELFGAGTASVRASFAALTAEVRERPDLGTAEMALAAADLDYDFRDFEEEGDTEPAAAATAEADFADEPDAFLEADLAGQDPLDSSLRDADLARDGDFATDLVPDDEPKFADEPRVRAVPDFGFEEEVAGGVFDGGRDFERERETIDVPDFFTEPAEPTEPAESPRAKRAKADAPTAQERYEARQRARGERGEAEPIVAAVEAAETRAPQRVSRRQPGRRPDPLRTRRPTRAR